MNTVYLQSLAVADNFVLIFSLIILSCIVGPIQIPSTLPTFRYVIAYVKKYFNPWGYITQCWSIWITVLLAINRFIAVCCPLVSKRWLTLNKARIQVAVVVVCSVAFNIPRFLQYNVVWKTNNNITYIPRKELSALGNNAMFDLVYFNIFYTVLIVIVPLIVVVVLYTILVRKIRRLRMKKERDSVTRLGSQERNITLVALIVVIELVLCHAPDRVLTIIKFIQTDQTNCPYALLYLSHIANFLLVINSSTDFFIYVIFSKRFRRQLNRSCKCCCCCCGKDDGQGWNMACRKRARPGEYGLIAHSTGTASETTGTYLKNSNCSTAQKDPKCEIQEMVPLGFGAAN